MSSSIFFKFKSMKDPMQITFDGTSLSVFEVKREIIAIARLGDGSDFDLEIYTPESMERYEDDTTQIPRSTTVIARRTPAQKPGQGRGARYVTGKMPITAKNQSRIEPALVASSKPVSNGTAAVANGDKELTEEEKLNAMFAADSGSWKAEQAQMTHKAPVRSSHNKPAAVPDKPPPPGYTCFRCGQKGHWIQACPTNTDPNWDRRFKKTTGIPTSMLIKVEKVLDEDGKPDFSKLPSGVMVNPNGDWMISAPDKAAWDKFQEKRNAAAEKAKDVAEDDVELSARGLQCPLDKHILNDPVKTPCCQTTYCRDCIENALLDGDLTCPNCGEQVLLDKLEVDDETAQKVKDYQVEKQAEKKQKDSEAAKSPVGSPKESEVKVDEAKSPAAADAKTVSSPKSRKRSADGELENDRKAPGPAAMAKTNSKEGKPAPKPAIPTGPKAMQAKNITPLNMPPSVEEFTRQMNAMSSMAGMQNGMPAMMNPMMMNPMMMNPMMNPMMNMGGFGMNGMGNGMGNFNGGWNGGANNNWNLNGMGNGMQQQQQQQGGGGDGAYFRQPVNPHRQQGRQKRPRSVDYKQM